jgi:hypothetical protein
VALLALKGFDIGATLLPAFRFTANALLRRVMVEEPAPTDRAPVLKV